MRTDADPRSTRELLQAVDAAPRRVAKHYAALRTAGGRVRESALIALGTGRRNVGTKIHTDERIFRPAPWPNHPTDADDHSCPVHKVTYASFRPGGITQKEANAYLRDHGGVARQGSDSWYGTEAKHGDVIKLMGVWKRNAWREAHGYCELPVTGGGGYWSRLADAELAATQVVPKGKAKSKAKRVSKYAGAQRETICFDTPRRGTPKDVCFAGTRRPVKGVGVPPHGGASCRKKPTGRFSATCGDDTTPVDFGLF